MLKGRVPTLLTLRKEKLLKKLGNDFNYLKMKNELSAIGGERKDLSRKFWLEFEDENQLLQEIDKMKLEIKSQTKRKAKKRKGILHDFKITYQKELSNLRLKLNPKTIAKKENINNQNISKNLRSIKSKIKDRAQKLHKKSTKRKSFNSIMKPNNFGIDSNIVRLRNTEKPILKKQQPRNMQKTNNNKESVLRPNKKKLNGMSKSKINLIKNNQELKQKVNLYEDVFNVFPQDPFKESKSVQVSNIFEVKEKKVAPEKKIFDYQELSQEIAANLGKVLTTSLGLVSQNIQFPVQKNQNFEKKGIKQQRSSVDVQEIMKKTIFNSNISENDQEDNIASNRSIGEKRHKSIIVDQARQETPVESIKNESVSIQEMPNFQTFQNFYKPTLDQPKKESKDHMPQASNKSIIKATEIPLIFEELKDAYKSKEKIQSERMKSVIQMNSNR